KAIVLATGALLKSRDPSRIGEVLARLAPDAATPEWVQTAILKGIERFLPKTPEGKLVAGNLPAEPSALLALGAQKKTPAGQHAATLLDLLKWPGKPGLENESAAIAA